MKSIYIGKDSMEEVIHVKIDHISLEGALEVPKDAKGIVLFAHGSGSSRHSVRNIFVAKALSKVGLGTLLIDLLSENEDTVYQTRFNIELLSQRLIKIVRFLQKNESTKNLKIGLFGASTGAAAALEVAADLGSEIKACVSRGGRPDLAMNVLHRVTTPTLLIVGGADFGVIELNQKAYAALTCVKHIDIVPHATHLFEEPGTLEEVARLSREWFIKYLEIKKQA